MVKIRSARVTVEVIAWSKYSYIRSLFGEGQLGSLFGHGWLGSLFGHGHV